MERLINKDIIKWSKDVDTKPLFILGARQVGKTYSVMNFANNHYKDKYVYFNFLDKSMDYSILKNTTNPNEIINAIEILKKVKIDNSWLIIFDEIQEMTNIRSSLKHFVEQKLGYKIICLGSYLGNLLKDNNSYPVGKITKLNMYPMNFEEFLIENGDKNLIDDIKHSLKNFSQISEVKHEYLSNLLKEYLLVGGMPDAVMEYIKNKNINDAIKVNENLMNDYNNDIIKYMISNNDKIKCKNIYENIPGFLAKENKKYMLSNIDKNARYSNYDVAIGNLIDTNIIYMINNLNTFSSPINYHQKDSEFKIYYNNPGFIATVFNLNHQIVYENIEYCNIKGALFENYILCELVQKINSKKIAYYSFRDQNNNSYEIDFCVENNKGNLIPIEVKSSKKYTTKSLNQLEKNNGNKDYSIIFSFQNFSKIDNRIKIPLYAIGFIDFESNRIKIDY